MVYSPQHPKHLPSPYFNPQCLSQKHWFDPNRIESFRRGADGWGSKGCEVLEVLPWICVAVTSSCISPGLKPFEPLSPANAFLEESFGRKYPISHRNIYSNRIVPGAEPKKPWETRKEPPSQAMYKHLAKFSQPPCRILLVQFYRNVSNIPWDTEKMAQRIDSGWADPH